MSNMIRKSVVVGKGGLIEITAPELEAGSSAEVIVLAGESAPSKKRRGLRRIIGSGKGAFASPEEADAFINGARDSWE